MTMTTQASTQRTPRPSQIGVVVSDKRSKTRTVEVRFLAQHAKYGKYMRRTTRLQVHDEQNTSKAGDRVEVAACRPISKTKSWRLVRVVEAAAAPLEHNAGV